MSKVTQATIATLLCVECERWRRRSRARRPTPKMLKKRYAKLERLDELLNYATIVAQNLQIGDVTTLFVKATIEGLNVYKREMSSISRQLRLHNRHRHR